MPEIDRSKTMRDKIRAAIRAVPRSKVSTYGAVARAAGYPHGARQVVQTLHRSFGLPWHRIVGSGGEIKLRGDSAVEQRLRLQAEGVAFRGRRVDYEQQLSFKLLINLHLIPRHQPIRLIRHPDDCHQFLEHRIRHALVACSRRM